MSAEDLIKGFEGCVLKAYADKGGRLTIGWGHAIGVTAGEEITQDQADAFLKQDVATAQAGVRRLVTAPITDNQLSALTSFVFNLGAFNLERSGLLKFLNRRQYQQAADQFLLWDKVGNYTDPVLSKRRAKERELFLLP
jgi:lysozyme